MATYQLTTLAQLRSALSTRLADPSNLFWQVTELNLYINEALRTWQAFSQFFTDKAQINTSSGTLFYNLSSLIPGLTPSITDQDLIEEIEYHLQEPINPTGWSGTEQFTYQGIVSAIQARRDKFILETGLTQIISEVDGPSPPETVLPLDDNIIDIRRAMWKDRNGVYSLLWRADEYTLTGFEPNWFTRASIPTDYSTVLNQPLTLQLAPPPSDAGKVHLVTVNSGPALDPATNPTILGIPDNFVWVVKYGALADLFSQPGPGEDRQRAQYCESRWKDGIQMARMTDFVKLGYQNGVPAFIDGLFELDSFVPSWVSGTSGPPQNLVAGGNIVATSPIPDGVYSLMFDIIPNMIVPSKDSDYIQIGQEFIDIIIDYAQHLAHLKEGSLELFNTSHLLVNFATAASTENDRLRANSQNFDILSDRTFRESNIKPRRVSDINLKALSYEE